MNKEKYNYLLSFCLDLIGHMPQLAHADNIPSDTQTKIVHQPGVTEIIDPKKPILEILLIVKLIQSDIKNQINGTAHPSDMLRNLAKGLRRIPIKNGIANTSNVTIIPPNK